MLDWAFTLLFLASAGIIILPVAFIVLLVKLIRKNNRSWADNKKTYVSMAVVLALLIADILWMSPFWIGADTGDIAWNITFVIAGLCNPVFIGLVLFAILTVLLVKLIRKKSRSLADNKKTYISMAVVLMLLAIDVFCPVWSFIGISLLFLAPAGLIALPVFIIILLVMLFREKSRAWKENKAYYISIAIALVLLIADIFYLFPAPLADPLEKYDDATQTKIEHAVNDAIISNAYPQYAEFKAAGHLLLMAEEQENAVTFYALVSFSAWVSKGEVLTCVWDTANPAVIIFSKDKSGKLSLKEYKEFEDGIDEELVKEMFPESLWNTVVDVGGEAAELYTQEDEQAKAYLKSIGREAVIKHYN